MPLAGRTALVTGGKRRVGLAIADAVRAAGGEVIAQLPRIDLLVNSAANFTREQLAEVTFASFDETFALNMRAPFFLARTLGCR
ncbi:MAG TPA: SDR family NAD(P)-dependent oxidoreductase [Thermoanaerobaculia bacterium]|jgi:NAD(P)-dependent dehydrogenase (short-subunit alcohol dehydrogenase family)|nr:SDR family NAD(P)-dependent oxidoreductase [Thermoanaerobaculia bacterium]